MKKEKALKHMAGLLDDLSFYYKVVGDKSRSKSLGKAARKLRKTRPKKSNRWAKG